MSAPSTVYNLIVKAMQLVGIVAVGEPPNPDELNDGLGTLQDLLEAWSIEHLAVWPTPMSAYNLVPGQGVYTFGPGGNFNIAVRPQNITTGYTVINGVTFWLTIIDQEKYNEIAIKTIQQQNPNQLLYVADYPLGIITLWPVPSAAIQLFLGFDRNIQNVVSLSDTLVWPPGYFRAVRYNLAVHLASEYGKSIPSEVASIAAVSKGKIKLSNKTLPLARFDSLLTDNNYVPWQRGY